MQSPVFIFFLEQRRRVACHFIKNKKETEGRQEPAPAQVQKTPPPHTHHQQEANSYRKIKEATTKTLTNLDTI